MNELVPYNEGSNSRIYLKYTTKHTVIIKIYKQKYNQDNLYNKDIFNINHPNMVKYLSLTYDKFGQFRGLTMEYVNGKTLFDLLQDPKDMYVKENHKKILYQIILGIEYLHDNDFVHSDIKPNNIMVSTSTGDIKIIDYDWMQHKTNIKPGIGSPYYQPPEYQIFDFKTYECKPKYGQDYYNNRFELSNSVDIWSYGCVVFELFYLKSPLEIIWNIYNVQKYINFMEDILENKNKNLINNFDLSKLHNFETIFLNTFKIKPKKRWSATKIKNSILEMQPDQSHQLS